MPSYTLSNWDGSHPEIVNGIGHAGSTSGGVTPAAPNATATSSSIASALDGAQRGQGNLRESSLTTRLGNIDTNIRLKQDIDYGHGMGSTSTSRNAEFLSGRAILSGTAPSWLNTSPTLVENPIIKHLAANSALDIGVGSSLPFLPVSNDASTAPFSSSSEASGVSYASNYSSNSFINQDSTVSPFTFVHQNPMPEQYANLDPNSSSSLVINSTASPLPSKKVDTADLTFIPLPDSPLHSSSFPLSRENTSRTSSLGELIFGITPLDNIKNTPNTTTNLIFRERNATHTPVISSPSISHSLLKPHRKSLSRSSPLDALSVYTADAEGEEDYIEQMEEDIEVQFLLQDGLEDSPNKKGFTGTSDMDLDSDMDTFGNKKGLNEETQKGTQSLSQPPAEPPKAYYPPAHLLFTPTSSPILKSVSLPVDVRVQSFSGSPMIKDKNAPEKSNLKTTVSSTSASHSTLKKSQVKTSNNANTAKDNVTREENLISKNPTSSASVSRPTKKKSSVRFSPFKTQKVHSQPFPNPPTTPSTLVPRPHPSTTSLSQSTPVKKLKRRRLSFVAMPPFPLGRTRESYIPMRDVKVHDKFFVGKRGRPRKDGMISHDKSREREKKLHKRDVYSSLGAALQASFAGPSASPSRHPSSLAGPSRSVNVDDEDDEDVSLPKPKKRKIMSSKQKMIDLTVDTPVDNGDDVIFVSPPKQKERRNTSTMMSEKRRGKQKAEMVENLEQSRKKKSLDRKRRLVEVETSSGDELDDNAMKTKKARQGDDIVSVINISDDDGKPDSLFTDEEQLQIRTRKQLQAQPLPGSKRVGKNKNPPALPTHPMAGASVSKSSLKKPPNAKGSNTNNDSQQSSSSDLTYNKYWKHSKANGMLRLFLNVVHPVQERVLRLNTRFLGSGGSENKENSHDGYTKGYGSTKSRPAWEYWPFPLDVSRHGSFDWDKYKSTNDASGGEGEVVVEFSVGGSLMWNEILLNEAGDDGERYDIGDLQENYGKKGVEESEDGYDNVAVSVYDDDELLARRFVLQSSSTSSTSVSQMRFESQSKNQPPAARKRPQSKPEHQSASAPAKPHSPQKLPKSASKHNKPTPPKIDLRLKHAKKMKATTSFTSVSSPGDAAGRISISSSTRSIANDSPSKVIDNSHGETISISTLGITNSASTNFSVSTGSAILPNQMPFTFTNNFMFDPTTGVLHPVHIGSVPNPARPDPGADPQPGSSTAQEQSEAPNRQFPSAKALGKRKAVPEDEAPPHDISNMMATLGTQNPNIMSDGLAQFLTSYLGHLRQQEYFDANPFIREGGNTSSEPLKSADGTGTGYGDINADVASSASNTGTSRGESRITSDNGAPAIATSNTHGAMELETSRNINIFVHDLSRTILTVDSQNQPQLHQRSSGRLNPTLNDLTYLDENKSANRTSSINSNDDLDGDASKFLEEDFLGDNLEPSGSQSLHDDYNIQQNLDSRDTSRGPTRDSESWTTSLGPTDRYSDSYTYNYTTIDPTLLGGGSSHTHNAEADNKDEDFFGMAADRNLPDPLFDSEVIDMGVVEQDEQDEEKSESVLSTSSHSWSSTHAKEKDHESSIFEETTSEYAESIGKGAVKSSKKSSIVIRRPRGRAPKGIKRKEKSTPEVSRFSSSHNFVDRDGDEESPVQELSRRRPVRRRIPDGMILYDEIPVLRRRDRDDDDDDDKDQSLNSDGRSSPDYRPKPPKISPKIDLTKRILWQKEDVSRYCHQCRNCNDIVKMDCKCRKIFCQRCIVRRYPGLNFKSKSRTCPFCEGICNCDHCCRKRNEPYISLRDSTKILDQYNKNIANQMQPREKPRIPDNRVNLATKTNLPRLATIPPSAEYWGTIYSLDGAKLGTSYSAPRTRAKEKDETPLMVFARTKEAINHTGGDLDVADERTANNEATSEVNDLESFAAPMPGFQYKHKNPMKVFVGAVQRIWKFGKYPKSRDLNELWPFKSKFSSNSKSFKSKASKNSRQKGITTVRHCVGNPAFLFYPIKPDPVSVDEWGDLSALSSLEDDECDIKKEKSSEDCSEIPRVQTPVEEAFTPDSLGENDVSRAIQLGLNACGVSVAPEQRLHVT